MAPLQVSAVGRPPALGPALVQALHGWADELSQVTAVLSVAGVAEPEQLTVADGDRRLLAFHHGLTGQDPELVLACPAGCVFAIRLSPDTLPARRPRSVTCGGGGLREPIYADLRGLPADRDTAGAELLRRCQVGTPDRELTSADLDAVDDTLDGPLVTTCAECGAQVSVQVDVQLLVLRRLAALAAAVDAEIHMIARAYGWDIAEIERLADDRRRGFVELIRAGL